MDMDEVSDLEIDLTPLIAHNANIDLTKPDYASSKMGPTIAWQHHVQQRPISKRRGKKRSSRACTSCRLRKVRCNIVPHGAPCSNCKHDEVECVLPLSRRQRAVKERAEQQKLSLSLNPSSPAIYNCENGDEGEDWCLPNQDRVLDDCLLQQEDGEQLIPPQTMTISEHSLSEILPAHSASQQTSPILGPTIAPGPRKSSLREPRSKFATFPLASPTTLPKIFAPFPANLKPTGISYLKTRGALALPSKKLQVALLKSYVEFIHPVLPIVDIDGFLEVVKDGKGRKLTLLLFQAVMLAAVEGVGENVLREECNGMSREEVVTIMVERVKLLYDFDTTLDRLTIVQSLLLLSYTLSNTTSPSQNVVPGHKDAHHYLGLALSLSFSLGLHRDYCPSPPDGTPIHDAQNSTIAAFRNSATRLRKLGKRLWWSLFLQDKVLQIHGKGFSRLRSEDSSVPMLELDDFDNHVTDDEESARDRMQARAFIERVRLCVWGCENETKTVRHHQPLPVSMYTYQDQFEHAQTQAQAKLAFQSTSRPFFTTPEEAAAPAWSPHHSQTYSYALSNSPSDADAEADAEAEILTPPRQEEFTFPLNPLSTEKGLEVRDVRFQKAHGHNERGVGKLHGVDGEYDDYIEIFGL